MSLTGAPLIAATVLATVVALAGTIASWRRGRRLRLPGRTAGVLVTEALLLFSVALVANRSQQFYPSWAALLQTDTTSGVSYAVKPGHLDAWLRTRRGPVTAFPWQPPGWTTWHLTGAPTLVVPDGYLRHPAWRYPVVLAVGGWPPAAEADAARAAVAAAGPAVVVFVPAGPQTTAGLLTTGLPAALAGDLRVTAHRWALVASGPGDALARTAVVRAAQRYPAIAVTTGTPAPVPLVPLPAGVATTVAAGLEAGLAWACGQTPPPLAASTPPVTHLPVHRHPRHPSGPASRTYGGSHVPGQPRR